MGKGEESAYGQDLRRPGERIGDNLVDGGLKRRDQERESEKEEGWLVLGE